MGIAEALTGGKSASFPTIGTKIGGKVVSSEMKQATEYSPNGGAGKPKVWDDGRPQMQAVVVVQTDAKDPADPTDDGSRAIYIKTWGPNKASLVAAVRGAGDTDVRPGGEFHAEYIADDTSTSPAGKLYRYTYTAPGSGISEAVNGATLNEQSFRPQAATPPPPPAPAAATPPPPPAPNPLAAVGKEKLEQLWSYMGAGWSDEQIAAEATGVFAGVSRETIAAARNARP